MIVQVPRHMGATWFVHSSWDESVFLLELDGNSGDLR